MYKMKKMNEGSWISHFIIPSNSGKVLSPGMKAKACKLGTPDGKSSQEVFSKRVVPRNSDPRSFMLVTKSFLFHDMDPVFFDPELDPPNKACFNCWEVAYNKNYKNRHQHYHCPKPKLRQFCENCGRQSVDVQNCPRCARGYRDYEKRGRKGKYAGKSIDLSKYVAKEIKSLTDAKLLGFNALASRDSENLANGFEFKIRDFERDIGKRAYGHNSVSHDRQDGCSTLHKDENYEIKMVDEDADENYEEMFVDENQRSESINSMNETVQDFLSMMDALKFLPIETQSCILLKFVKNQRELFKQNKSLGSFN